MIQPPCADSLCCTGTLRAEPAIAEGTRGDTHTHGEGGELVGSMGQRVTLGVQRGVGLDLHLLGRGLLEDDAAVLKLFAQSSGPLICAFDVDDHCTCAAHRG